MGAVAVGEVGRLWRRRVVAEEPVTAPEVIQKGARAALDTVEVARRGYQQAATGETALFNLLSAFVISSSTVRLTTFGVRRGVPLLFNVRDRPAAHPPLRARASCSRSPPAPPRCSCRTAALRETLAIPLGAGIGLTFDESALLLELEDVYWSREGLRRRADHARRRPRCWRPPLLALRILRRGERSMEERHELPRPVRDPFAAETQTASTQDHG